MYKVYLAIPRALDKLLGQVTEEGKIYRSKAGLDQRLGWVDLSSGKVFENRLGPDKYVGYVDLKDGKVYHSQMGPDNYVGGIGGDGKMYRHVAFGSDNYIAKIEPFVSFAHAGGAMLLLVLPELDQYS